MMKLIKASDMLDQQLEHSLSYTWSISTPNLVVNNDISKAGVVNRAETGW